MKESEIKETDVTTKKKRSLLSKLLRIFGWIVISIVGLVLLVLILIQLPFVQNYGRKKVVTYLEHKLKTKVEIGRLSIRFPTTLSLQKVYFEDQAKDTLLYGKELRVNIAMLRLLRNEIRIQEIDLDGIVGKVHRQPPDSTFNFQYIVDAFTSEKTKQPEKQDTSTLNMSIDRVKIDNSHIIYKDFYTGNDVDLHIGHFKTVIKKFDLSHMSFDITLLDIDGLQGHFNQLEPLQKPIENTVKEANSEPGNEMKLQNRAIRLANIDFQFNSDASHLKSSYVIGKAELHPKTIDLKNMIIAFKDASMANSNIVIQTNSSQPNKPEKIQETNAPPSPSLKITADELSLNKSSFKMDDVAAPKAPSGMDFSHLFLSDINVETTNLLYSADTMKATVKSGSLKEQSGFVLNNMTVDFEMNPTGVSLQNLLIKTPGSEIQRFAVLHYPSLESLKTDPGKLGLDIDLQNSTISLKDVLTFMPTLKDKIALSPDQFIYIDSRLTGTVNNLNIQNLILKGLSATRINVHGTITGLPETKNILANLDIETFQTNRKDINALVPAGTLPANINLPDRIAMSGQVKGGMENLTTNLHVNTNLGNAFVNGTVANISDKKNARYDMNVSAERMQLGTILNNPQLGIFTGNAKVKGRGLEPQTANATFVVNVPEVDYNKYRYQNIHANGNIAKGNFTSDLAVNDPNLRTKMAVSGSFVGKYPSISLQGVIDSVDAEALHFSDSTLKYHGRISADFTSINPDSLNGKLFVTKSILLNKEQRITIDTLSVIAKTGDTSSIAVNTGFASLLLKGKYKLTQLGDVFQNAINPYYKISDSAKKATDPYNFTITGMVYDNPATIAVLPGLKDLETIQLYSKFESGKGWNLNLKSPHINYNSMVIDKLAVTAGAKDSALTFDVNMGQFVSGTSIKVYATELKGALQNNKLNFWLDVKDDKSKGKYYLSGMLNQNASKDFVFKLNPDSLRLNYDKWKVSPQNEIILGKDGIIAHQFTLSQGDQQLSINSETDAKTSPLLVTFSNFQIATLTGFVQSDSLIANGLLNGKATVKNLNTSLVFLTDLTVDNLSVYNDTLGNLSVKVDNAVSNKYHANVALKGRGNDIAILGDYFVKPKNSSFDFTVNLNKFQMKSLEGLTNHAIKRADGFVYGKIVLNGNLAKPNIDGKIQFDNTSFVPAALNNVFKVDKEAIAVINNEGVIFNSFTIRDTANNGLTLGGQVKTKDWKNYSFDMNIKADNFQAINSTKKDNKLFYGKMVFSTRLNIKGTPTQPVVDGDLTINEKTSFTVVLPSQDPGVEKREGIVRFVDYSAIREDSLFMMAPYDSLKKAPLVGYDVAININIDPKAEFNLIVDPANGDFLRLRGTGQLSGGIDPSGKINLTGSYEIDQGSYSLSFNFLKRKFLMQKGSRIVWTGDPTSAQLDITAVYETNTAPYDLVAGMTEGNNIYFKQKLPFEVHLNMKGELLKPDIGFDIVLPDKNYTVGTSVINTVQERLLQLRQEPSELNKQVFALLLLNRFVGENPFNNSSGGGMDAGTFAKQSASRLLTEQLNNLAAGLIQGVDVNFDLASTEDYSTGTKRDRTDFKVSVSKSLLNDRLTVTVGNNFELEGPQPTNQQHSGIADNISINYKLSKDGRYMLRAYRKNDYTGALEGYVVETGLGFIITVDYNKFSSIFQSKSQREKKREIKKHNRELKKEDAALKEEETQPSTPSSENEEKK